MKHQRPYRDAARRQNRNLGHFLAIQAWLGELDCLVLSRENLQQLLETERLSSEQVEWFREDTEQWFPYQVAYPTTGFESLFLGRVSIEEYLPSGSMPAEERISRMNSWAPRTGMLSELPPKMSHLCTREIVSHLALLSSGSIEPSMQHVLKTKAPSKPVEKPLQGTLNDSKQLFKEELTNVLCDILLNEKIPSDVINKQTGKIIIPANRKITRTFVLKLADDYDHLETECGLIQGCIRNVIGLLKNAQKQLGSSD